MSEMEKLNKSNKAKQDLKNTTIKVVLKKKSLDNGDLSKYIPDNLKNTNSNSKNFNNEKRRVKPLTITQQNEKDEKEFITSFNSVKSNQDNLNKKLKNVPFNQGNKNVKFNIKQRLPKTLDEIEDNEELVKLLLKNPNEMTPEEKFYIASLNKEEFKRFVEFLKRKNRELGWRGNDWGSGRYLDEYINIYRQTGHSESERFQSLQKFLKLNHDNGKAEKTNRELSFLKKSKENNFLENFDKNENDSTQNQMTKNLDIDLHHMKNSAFEATSKVILNELEKFKNIILSHKNEASIKKVEVQNKIVFDDLEKKTKVMRDDVKKIKEVKEKDNSDMTQDIDKLYEVFKKKTKNMHLDLNKHLEESSLIKKINSYLNRMNLSPNDLINKLDDDSIISSMIDLNKAREAFLRLKILDEKECDSFLNTLKKYHGNKIKVEYLVCILESYVFDDIKDILKENAKSEEEEEPDNDDDYDYYGVKLDSRHINDKVMSKKALQDFDFMMTKKAAMLVQRLYRGYRYRKEFKLRWIYLNILAKRITIRIRKYAQILKRIKNESAHKITYLMRKHYINKSLNKNLSKSTQRWLQGGKNLANLPFSHKNKVRGAIQIQRAWRKYKDRIMKKFFDRNSSVMDMNMLKTKTCFVCLMNRVSHLCRDVTFHLYKFF